jgi:hypothetical protein
MAVKPYTIGPQGPNASPKVSVISWLGLGNGDSGDPISLSEMADRSIQIVGTYSTGGEAVFEGSNDGTNYATLKDPFGNDIDLLAAGLVAVTEAVLLARPRVIAGDVNTLLNFYLLVRRGY